MLNRASKASIAVFCAVLMFAAGFATARLQTAAKPETAPPQPPAVAETKPLAVSVIIDANDGTPLVSPEIAWEEGLTAFRALQKFSEQAAFAIDYKDYGGDLGVFVQAIHGKNDPDGKKWWQFWVNGKYAVKGSSVTALRPGDSVFWKLAPQMQ